MVDSVEIVETPEGILWQNLGILKCPGKALERPWKEMGFSLRTKRGDRGSFNCLPTLSPTLDESFTL